MNVLALFEHISDESTSQFTIRPKLLPKTPNGHSITETGSHRVPNGGLDVVSILQILFVGSYAQCFGQWGTNVLLHITLGSELIGTHVSPLMFKTHFCGHASFFSGPHR